MAKLTFRRDGYSFETGANFMCVVHKTKRIVNVLAVSLFLTLLSHSACFSQQAIKKEKSWAPVSDIKINSRFEHWFIDSSINKSVAIRIRSHLATTQPNVKSGSIDHLVSAIAIADTKVAQLTRSLQQAITLDDFNLSSTLENLPRDNFLQNHAKLLIARWLARNQFYDESLSLLNQIAVSDVLDPATLLYYRGLMQHQLLKRDECIKTLDKLLEHENQIPRRYAVLAKLMLADIQRLESDSLNEISRMMGDVQRRTNLGRSGQRVLNQERDVIEKLDKLIKQLEEQQQMQAASKQKSTPSSPADREQRLAGQGSGNVKSKRQNDGGQWGNMKPEERDAALAEMSKDLPPHYRSVIEDYFRKPASQTEKRQ